jgi:hypothetical protein
MRRWSDSVIPLAAAGLVLIRAQRVHGQVLATHRLPAALALEAVAAAVAACAAQGYGVTATVIDVDAQRIAVLRGDTAGIHTFEASWGKAYTAVGFAPDAETRQQQQGGGGAGTVLGRTATWHASLPAARAHDLPGRRVDHQAWRGGDRRDWRGRRAFGGSRRSLCARRAGQDPRPDPMSTLRG